MKIENKLEEEISTLVDDIVTKVPYTLDSFARQYGEKGYTAETKRASEFCKISAGIYSLFARNIASALSPLTDCKDNLFESFVETYKCKNGRTNYRVYEFLDDTKYHLLLTRSQFKVGLSYLPLFGRQYDAPSCPVNYDEILNNESKKDDGWNTFIELETGPSGQGLMTDSRLVDNLKELSIYMFNWRQLGGEYDYGGPLFKTPQYLFKATPDLDYPPYLEDKFKGREREVLLEDIEKFTSPFLRPESEKYIFAALVK